MGFAEFVFSAALATLFWKRGLPRRFPAMGTYLVLRMVSTPILSLLFIAYSSPSGQRFFLPYFLLFWIVYLVSAILVYFICLEVFRSALVSLPGLMRFGLVIFRWAGLVSVIVTFATVPLTNRGIFLLPDIAASLMRAVSLVELFLLGFLCLSMNALRLTVRDLSFGLALGLGAMSANDFIYSSFAARGASLTTPLQFMYESVILLSLATWMVYCALPETARKPMVVPVNSTIYRWNEIASALGHTGTQVAVQQPANSFFLTDVENVVERVLNRTRNQRESES